MEKLFLNLSENFAQAQQALFETFFQPLIYAFGLGGLLEDGFAATGWFLLGLIQIVILLVLIAPLQRLFPVEPIKDKSTVRTDILYTLIHRLGAFRLALFFTLDPLLETVFGALRVQGMGTFHLDQFVFQSIGVEDALLGFLIYLIVFDFADYWIHRAQHQSRLWWQLHSLHHAQQQMTMWSDNRNHLLDDLLRDAVLVSLGLLVGIAPSQFMLLVAFTQLSESFQHANVKIHFGAWGERLWVSPRFHRLHHAVGLGHEFPALDSGANLRISKPRLGGANFGVLLPWWDILFRTANFEIRYEKTGVRDQIEQGRDYGRGFISQQILGIKRLLGKA